jgi:hypothetical protein
MDGREAKLPMRRVCRRSIRRPLGLSPEAAATLLHSHTSGISPFAL